MEEKLIGHLTRVELRTRQLVDHYKKEKHTYLIFFMDMHVLVQLID